MAAIKISTLTAKTVPVAADSFVIVDSAAADNKKVSYSDLRSTILDAETTINESGADVDFRVEGVGEANALFVQGSDGFVGIGTGTPTRALEIAGSNATPSSNISALFGDGIIAGKTYIGRWSTNSTYAGLYHSGSNSSTDYILIQSADGSTYLNAHTSGSIYFRLDNNDKVVINRASTTTLEVNGNIGFTNDGDGIDFGNVSGSSSTSTLLDDYEEGTWTPDIYGASTAGTATYAGNGQVGTYTKIGNRVYITAWVDVTGHTGTGSMEMNGLPYVPNGGTNEYHALSVRPSNLTIPQAFLHAYVDDNSDLIVFKASSTGGADSFVQIDTSFTLMVTGFYRV